MIRRTTRQSWWPILLLAALVGPPLGWLVHHTGARAEEARAQIPFRDLVAEKAFRLEKEVLAIANVARSIRAFYDSSETVTRTEFASFVSGPLQRLTAIRAIEFAPRVRHEARAAHEAATRAEGFLDYGIREAGSDGVTIPAGERAEYVPVHYLEPLEDNESALGLDLASEVERRRTLDEAARTGEPTLSHPLHLVQAEPTQVAFLLSEAVRADEAAGLEEPEGYIILVLTAHDLLCSTELACEGGVRRLLSLRLEDVGDPGASDVIYEDPSFEPGEGEVVRDLLACGRIWRLRANPTVAFLEGRSTLQPFLLGLATLCLWIVLVGFAGLGVRRLQEKALSRQSRTIRSVLSALGEGVVVSDPDGHILYGNEAARSLVGQRHEVTPTGGWAKTCGFFLPDALTPYPEDELPLARALHGERVPETEVYVCNERRPQGAWLGISGSPLRGPGGSLQGGVVVLRDVTERRRFQAQRVEMRLAALVQQNLYPPHAPAVDGLDLAGDVVSAEATCGDYYDFLPLGDGRMALVIGDVSGHGLGPALVMGQVRAYLRSIATSVTRPDEILTRINRLLTPDLRDRLFVTLLIVLIDPSSDRLEYASAGHTPAYVLGEDGAIRHELLRTGIPLGIYADSTYTLVETATLRPGETLLMMTDGVPESRSPQGSFLTEDGALELLRDVLGRPAAEIVRHLREALEAFREARAPDDDITMIVARRIERPSRVPSRPDALAPSASRGVS